MSNNKKGRKVNYRKKTGKVRQHEPFLNTNTSTKPDLGTPIDIGEAIVERIALLRESAFNSFDLKFGVKFEKALQEHKKNGDGGN